MGVSVLQTLFIKRATLKEETLKEKHAPYA